MTAAIITTLPDAESAHLVTVYRPGADPQAILVTLTPAQHQQSPPPVRQAAEQALHAHGWVLLTPGRWTGTERGPRALVRRLVTAPPGWARRPLDQIPVGATIAVGVDPHGAPCLDLGAGEPTWSPLDPGTTHAMLDSAPRDLVDDQGQPLAAHLVDVTYRPPGAAVARTVTVARTAHVWTTAP
ncbi:hypothetical protein [Nocardiopsis sp. NPDC006938]|uniref:hypothetical protein n=1 Tax=Nocardiopsis sp. NPDC006938 TaxID=3364337 RepID=UPI00367E0D5E